MCYNLSQVKEFVLCRLKKDLIVSTLKVLKMSVSVLKETTQFSDNKYMKDKRFVSFVHQILFAYSVFFIFFKNIGGDS